MTDKSEQSELLPWVTGHFRGQYVGHLRKGSIRTHNIFEVSIVRGTITQLKYSNAKPNIENQQSDGVLQLDSISNIYMHKESLSFGEQSEQKWQNIENLYQVELYNYTMTPKDYSADTNTVHGTVSGTIVSSLYPSSTPTPVKSKSERLNFPHITPPKFGCFARKISLLTFVTTLNYTSMEVLSIFNLHFFPVSFVELPSEDVVLDTDGDGILDLNDPCPVEPEDIDGFEDEDGCPEIDNDNDGILDVDDKCINIPGVVELDGCPSKTSTDIDEKFMDNDVDGIPNFMDKCPEEAETINNYNDLDGCPDTIPDEIKELIGRQEAILFETKTAKLRDVSNSKLENLLKILETYPTIQIIIEGHTDSKGTMAYNQDLSERRAEAVREWMIEKGVGRKRILTKGYAYRKPIAENDTEEGRQKNRRVEFNCYRCYIEELEKETSTIPEEGSLEGNEVESDSQDDFINKEKTQQTATPVEE